MRRFRAVYVTGSLLCLQMILAGCATSTLKSTSAGQSESFDALTGMWQGEVEEKRMTGTGKLYTITTPATLIIYQANDETATEGWYSGAGRVSISIIRNNGPIVIHFRTPANNLVDLNLFGDTLAGVIRYAQPYIDNRLNITLKRATLKRAVPDVMVRQSRRGLVATLPPQVQITEMQDLAGSWKGLEPERSGHLPLLHFYEGGRTTLLSIDVCELTTSVEDGRILWEYHGRRGSLTLHEADGTRVLRMVTDNSVTADFVFNGE